jgi:hypothetical protein
MEVIMRFGDIERPNALGRRMVALSATGAVEAREAGCSAVTVDEALATVLVVADDDAVVTVLRGTCVRRARTPRRPSRRRGYTWGAQ